MRLLKKLNYKKLGQVQGMNPTSNFFLTPSWLNLFFILSPNLCGSKPEKSAATTPLCFMLPIEVG